MKITNEGWAVIERDTHIGKWVVENKRLDFDQNALPQMLPYIDPNKEVVDIGANIGCYSYAFAKVAKRVYCFEPNMESLGCLIHNLSDQKNVMILPHALSDDRFYYHIVNDNNNIGMAYVSSVKYEGVVTAFSFSSTYKLDDFFTKNLAVAIPDLYSVGFIKIDVEGYELHVLRGGEKTINTHKPVMVIEINDHTLKRTGVDRNEIFEWLLSHGYSFRNIYQEQGLTDDQLDIICFPS